MPIIKFKKNKSEWILLFSMIAVFIILFLFNNTLFFTASIHFLHLLKKIVPILVIVYFMIFLFHVLIKPNTLKKHIGKNAGFKGTIYALIGGVVSMGSIYVWYPFLAELKTQGMSNRLLAIFLYNRAVKITLLPMMVVYFGIEYTIVLSALMILLSIMVGWLVELLVPTTLNEKHLKEEKKEKIE